MGILVVLILREVVLRDVHHARVGSRTRAASMVNPVFSRILPSVRVSAGLVVGHTRKPSAPLLVEESIKSLRVMMEAQLRVRMLRIKVQERIRGQGPKVRRVMHQRATLKTCLGSLLKLSRKPLRPFNP